MLAGWLTKAAKVFKTTPTAPEPFEITCECGGIVSGTRAALQQKLNCAHCGKPAWVLPADVYPAVKSTHRPSAAPAAAKQSAAKSPTKKSKTPQRDAADRMPRQSATVKESTPEETDAKGVAPDSAPELLTTIEPDRRKRRRTFQVVIFTMLALVSVTGWSLWNRQVRERARSSVPQAAESGLAALHSGQFTEAAARLGSAVRGLDVLRQDDAWAQGVRRSHREAVAAENLSPVSILDLAAARLSGGGSDEEKQRQFQSQHGNSWMLWDLALVPQSVDSGALELDVPLAADNRPLQVHCEFPELLAAANEITLQTPQRVIFAAQIDRWIISEESQGSMVAVLKPSTAFLWTDYESFSAAGYRPLSEDEAQQTRDLLLRQRQQVLP